MKTKRLTLMWIVLTAMSCVLFGCLERKEHLKISLDGRVAYHVECKSDSLNDLMGPDAVPQLAGGWLVEQSSDRDNDGKVTYKLVADSFFGRGAALPSNFAVANDADTDLYLQFPTQVKMEKRSDGMYCHFTRTYPARPWEYIESLRRKCVDEPLADIKSLEPKDWTDDQRIAIVKALATFEVEKLLIFARAAWKEQMPDAGQDRWIAVRNDIRAFLEQMDYQTMAKLLEPRQGDQSLKEKDDELSKAVEAESRKFEAASVERLKDGLRNLARCDGTQTNAILVAYDRQKKFFEVTQDLEDDKFEIVVEMPGPIVAHNAEGVEGRTATWRFEGNAVRDKEIELMVTSRVEK